MTIKPVNTANLEGILTRIWNGELEHNQESCFCKTACCVAGWDVALNYPTDYENYSNGLELVENSAKAFLNPLTWSMLNNNLYSDEATLMFDPNSTQYLQQVTLEAFKAGRRLSMQNGVVRFVVVFWRRNHYDNGAVQLTTDSKEDRNALIKFLGDYDDSKIQVS